MSLLNVDSDSIHGSSIASSVSGSPAIILLDGNNIVFRNHIGFSQSGVQTPGVYGTLRFLLGLFRFMDPLENQYIMCWDTGRDPERVALYPDYKTPRQDEETYIDRQVVSEECRILEKAVMATPVATALGYPGPAEGDDLIYSIVSDVSRVPGWTCVVVSDDSDLLQMFSEFQFILYSPQRRLVIRNAEEASDLLGYPCDRMVFYKALCGDPSDRIPGIGGIGKTSALQVVSRYRDPQEFLSAPVDSIGSIKRIGSRLIKAREHPEVLSRNMDLIRLRKVGYHILDGAAKLEDLVDVLRPIGLSFFRSYFSQYM